MFPILYKLLGLYSGVRRRNVSQCKPTGLYFNLGVGRGNVSQYKPTGLYSEVGRGNVSQFRPIGLYLGVGKGECSPIQAHRIIFRSKEGECFQYKPIHTPSPTIFGGGYVHNCGSSGEGVEFYS